MSAFKKLGDKITRSTKKYLRTNARFAKKVRKVFGLTGSSRHMRQLKRSIKNLFGSTGSLSPLSSSSSTGAGSGFVYDTSRTLSRLTGGV